MGPLWGHCGDAGDPPRSGSMNTAAITAISCGSVITSTGSPQLPLGAELGWGAGEGLGGVWGSPPPQLLTLRRMMSISEYFMPFTRMGMSLQQGGGQG